jgi:UDP-N-acetylmuramyl pentapeptide synthase
MAELGDKSDAYHRQIGDFAKSLDINQLYSFQSDYGVQNFNNEAELLTCMCFILPYKKYWLTSNALYFTPLNKNYK